MGSLNLTIPQLEDQQIQQYLFQMVEQLNLADWSAKGILTEIAAVEDSIQAAEDSGLETPSKLAEFQATKDLIIKTADYAVENASVWSKAINGSFQADSDFGKYVQDTSMKIIATSKGVTQLFEYTAGINKPDGQSSQTLYSQQYVKTGYLFDRSSAPIYGVAIGVVNTALDGQSIVKDKVLTLDAQRISFWDSNTEIAYISGSKMHFPQGKLECNMADITGTLSADRINGGTINGNTVSVINLSASSITSGTFSADRISGGTINGNTVSVTNLSASNITGGTLNVDRIAANSITTGHISSLSAAKIANGNNYQTSVNFYGGNILADSASCYGMVGQWCITNSGTLGNAYSNARSQLGTNYSRFSNGSQFAIYAPYYIEFTRNSSYSMKDIGLVDIYKLLIYASNKGWISLTDTG